MRRDEGYFVHMNSRMGCGRASVEDLASRVLQSKQVAVTVPLSKGSLKELTAASIDACCKKSSCASPAN